MTERGLSRSRTQAARSIGEGHVSVDGKVVFKSSSMISEDQSISLTVTDAYVSRAAHKLVAALDAFNVSAAGRQALDVGASTGGFTQVLLERGVAHVIALDVGHGQLVEQIRQDPRVSVIEGVNARYLEPGTIQQALGKNGAAEAHDPAAVPDLVVADLSFISLGQVLPALVTVAAHDADFVVLIKPQFEVGRTGIKEGLVRDASRRADAITGVLFSAWDAGLRTAGLIASPIAGGAGNREYLAWLSASVGSNPTEWFQTVSQLSRNG